MNIKQPNMIKYVFRMMTVMFSDEFKKVTIDNTIRRIEAIPSKTIITLAKLTCIFNTIILISIDTVNQSNI